MSYRLKKPWPPKPAQLSHADDWLMTYADMITLLLCFFIVLLISTIHKKDIAPKTPMPTVAAKVAVVSAPIAKPEPVPATTLPDIFQNDRPFHKIEPADLIAAAPTEKTIADSAVVAPVPVIDPPAPMPDKIDPVAPPVVDVPPAPPAMSLPSQPLDDIIAALKTPTPPAFEPKGDRITSLEVDSAAFFYRGSAMLSEPGLVILRDVATQLKADQYKDYQVTVEGHTDDTPIHTAQFPSNWELSTARAAAVVHFLLDQGIAATKLRAAGYADSFPLAANRDAKGNTIPENQARNRRVVIKLEKIDKNNP